MKYSPTSSLAADREVVLLMYNFELEVARLEAREQGQRMLLLRQAQIRFGKLPIAVERRVQDATAEKLLAWGEHLMTAESLEAWCAAIEA